MAAQTKRRPAQQAQGLGPSAPAKSTVGGTSEDPQDTLGNAAIQEMLAGGELRGSARQAGGAKYARYQRADGAVDGGANAQWESTPPDVRSHTEVLPSGDVGLVIDAFEVDYSYWASSDAVWNDIADFPGGPYDPTFNTREGALKHEEAEVEEAEYAFDEYENDMLNVVEGVTYPTVTVAAAVWNRDDATAGAAYNQACTDLRTHANDAGPQAEWAFYQSQAAAQEKDGGEDPG